jgi:hypothetical protein
MIVDSEDLKGDRSGQFQGVSWIERHNAYDQVALFASAKHIKSYTSYRHCGYC